MAKPPRTFEALFDQLDDISARLDYLLSVIDTKAVTPLSSDLPLLTTRKAAEFLGISPKTIYNNPDRYPHVKLKGGGLRFRKADLEQYAAAPTSLA